MQLLLLLLCVQLASSTIPTEKDLPTFFEDTWNIYAVVIGASLIIISSLVSLYLCSLGDKRRRNELLNDLDQSDE